ncbi:MAG: DUF2974 domain-containing protein, partial [Ruminococcaceae bacterium]|nr:DUF2974 domain-containing protein [Oscillospiraceae bacterium]
EEIKSCNRFGSVLLYDYVNKVDSETQTQFSAITAKITKGLYCVCFRGTDQNLVGWKEDFNMAFISPVPGQTMAKAYLEKAARKIRGKIIVCGHSKGGNFAIYSSAMSNDKTKAKISCIYNYDGPGFESKFLQSAEYESIKGKVTTFIPQSSVVGMLLEHEDDYTIIHSSNNVGIMQHDFYSWDVICRNFVYTGAMTNDSRAVDKTLKSWLNDMTYEQRELFIDTIYNIVLKTNAKTVKELTDNWFSSAGVILRSVKDLDEPTKKAVNKALLEFAKCAKNSIFTVGSEEIKNLSDRIKNNHLGSLFSKNTKE